MKDNLSPNWCDPASMETEWLGPFSLPAACAGGMGDPIQSDES